MARLSHDEMGQIVVSALQSLGGTATQEQLKAALPAEDRQNIAMQFLQLRRMGIVSAIVKNVDGKMQSVYSVGGGV